MAKMIFNKSIRYEGITYPPNTEIEVLDNHIQDLKLSGGWIINEPILEVEVEPVEESKSEIEILREKAIQLGIDFKGNWGEARLKKAIDKAEKGE